jgi:hypothetical protein
MSNISSRAPYHIWSRLIVRRLARAVKRVVPLGRPNRPPGPRPPDRERFEQVIETAGLSVSSVEYVGPAKTGGQRGGQIVFAARKTG